jgi:glutathione peroxidase
MRCSFLLHFVVGLAGPFAFFLSGCSAGSSSEPGPTSASDRGSATAGNSADQKGVPKDTQADPSENAPSATKVSGVVNASCTPGEAGSLYALKVTALGGSSEIPMCAYEDTVVLIVNGASGCGYTPQYKPLEALYTKYHETQNEKFEVLAFPSDSFNQEKDSDQAVSEFCTTEYNITFPLTTIGPVIDDSTKNVTAQPVYKWLYAQPGYGTPVAWNFEKFLVSKQGKVVKRWLSATSPDEGGEIDLAIAAELAK